MGPRLVPLQNLRIEIVVDDVKVVGLITDLVPSDLDVEIIEPFRDLRTCTHVPFFAMQAYRLATDDGRKTIALTERGLWRAKQLLRGLYEYGCGRPVRWGLYERRQGEWVPVPTDK